MDWVFFLFGFMLGSMIGISFGILLRDEMKRS